MYYVKDELIRSMKLPRGVSGDLLIRTTEQVGYSIVRQRGSPVRLQHPGTTIS